MWKIQWAEWRLQDRDAFKAKTNCERERGIEQTVEWRDNTCVCSYVVLPLLCVCVSACWQPEVVSYTLLMIGQMRIWSFKAKIPVLFWKHSEFLSVAPAVYLRMITDRQLLFTQLYILYLPPHYQCASKRDCVSDIRPRPAPSLWRPLWRPQKDSLFPHTWNGKNNTPTSAPGIEALCA